MEINVKSKFNVGDRVQGKDTVRIGTITAIRYIVTQHRVAFDYQVAFDDGDRVKVCEDNLKLVECIKVPKAAKFKVGDRVVSVVTTAAYGRVGVVEKVFARETMATAYAVRMTIARTDVGAPNLSYFYEDGLVSCTLELPEVVKPVTSNFKVGDLVVLKNTELMAGYEFGEIISHKDEMWGIVLKPGSYRYVCNESDMVPYIPTSPHYFQD